MKTSYILVPPPRRRAQRQSSHAWKKERGSDDYEFRSVTPDDLERQRTVNDFIDAHLTDWQAKGWIPDMRIEAGDKTDEPIRTRWAVDALAPLIL